MYGHVSCNKTAPSRCEKKIRSHALRNFSDPRSEVQHELNVFITVRLNDVVAGTEFILELLVIRREHFAGFCLESLFRLFEGLAAREHATRHQVKRMLCDFLVCLTKLRSPELDERDECA